MLLLKSCSYVNVSNALKRSQTVDNPNNGTVERSPWKYMLIKVTEGKYFNISISVSVPEVRQTYWATRGETLDRMNSPRSNTCSTTIHSNQSYCPTPCWSKRCGRRCSEKRERRERRERREKRERREREKRESRKRKKKDKKGKRDKKEKKDKRDKKEKKDKKDKREKHQMPSSVDKTVPRSHPKRTAAYPPLFIMISMMAVMWVFNMALLF